MGRDTNEKITDGARGLFEKATGYVLFSIVCGTRLAREEMGGKIRGNLIPCCATARMWMPSIRTNKLAFAGKLLILSGRTRPWVVLLLGV
jgi:hypothetical protein